MDIESVKHKSLKRLLERGEAKGLPTELSDRIIKMISVLILADDLDWFQANAPRGWHLHQLTGSRRGTWSLSVSGNWRLTFRVQARTIYELNLEDYH